MKKKSKFAKAIILVAVVVLGLSTVIAVKALSTLQEYKKTINEITIENVDLSKIADGTYNGQYDALMVAADVAVTVKDHKITDIRLVSHKNGKGQPAEVIPQRVVEEQSLEVDIVSGATSSSKVILKAIENALNSKAAQ